MLAAYNEESHIGRRIRELARLVAALPGGGEVIVVFDGSTDGAAEAARSAAIQAQCDSKQLIPSRVLVLPTNMGEAAVLNNEVCAVAVHPLLFLADARQICAPDAIDQLPAKFLGLALALGR